MENTEKKIKILIKPQCEPEIRNRFITKFGEKCEFVFEENEIRDSITTAEVVIGEPEESELRKAENLHWIQLTWAGAENIPGNYYTDQCFRSVRKNYIGICDREHHCPVSRTSCLLEKQAGTSLGTE